MAAITLTISAVLAIIAGILVIAFPRILRYAIGIYLILVGVLQILDLTVVLSPLG